MRVPYEGEIKDVDVRLDGDVRVITLEGATWRIRITLTPDGVRLIDAATGTVLWKQDLASLDIRYREGKYYPEKKERDRLLTGFVIAWILLRPRH